MANTIEVPRSFIINIISLYGGLFAIERDHVAIKF